MSINNGLLYILYSTIFIACASNCVSVDCENLGIEVSLSSLSNQDPYNCSSLYISISSYSKNPSKTSENNSNFLTSGDCVDCRVRLDSIKLNTNVQFNDSVYLANTPIVDGIYLSGISIDSAFFDNTENIEVLVFSSVATQNSFVDTTYVTCESGE